jgi:hypothetical protein
MATNNNSSGSEARMAENEATFRDANEQIQRRARALEFDEAIPFLCECGEPTCQEIIPLTLDEYEAARAESTTFFVVPGHEKVAGPSAEIVDRSGNYLVIDKDGIAAEIAERRDPRQQASER